MSTREDPRGITTLFSDLANNATRLVQAEFRLLRTEMSEKVGQVKNGLVEMIAGAICLLAALLVLLQALVVALAEMGLGTRWASLAVGVVVAIVGVILVRIGTSNMSESNLMPERTQHQLGDDARAVKDQMR
ncbi:phage holin family protein [Chelativorans sp. AA-79]|uniref:phage holin family protein n=1 Tax=Chelativorans sp. AA-79 TaxID=3028735 RepID=UPI0023F79176|nr:phage holin family protein [Chelativorans sp. AA-79]WEX07696.1 phage holin family protein [Chelativorans sp. AA-79]